MASANIRDQHFPGLAPIDAYGVGGFRFADMSHRGSILCLPSGIYGWDARNVEDFSATSFARIFAESDEIEILLVGTGLDLKRLPPALHQRLREARISADPMSTGAAVRTYNVLLAEKRRVAAALLVVD